VLSENSCIIVVEINLPNEEGRITVGLLADQVLAVVQLAAVDIQPHPEMGTGLSSRFLRGVGKVDDDFYMLLDVEAIINGEGEGEG